MMGLTPSDFFFCLRLLLSGHLLLKQEESFSDSSTFHENSTKVLDPVDRLWGQLFVLVGSFMIGEHYLGFGIIDVEMDR